MSQVSCPACSSSFVAKPEWAGKRIRCSGCGKLVHVPSGPTKTDEEGDASSEARPTTWLLLGATLVIALAVGAACGFIFGHRQGRSENAREIAEAQALVGTADQKLRAAEADVAKAIGEREKVKEQLNALVWDHDARLAAAKQSEEEAKTRARTAEERLQAAANAEAAAAARGRKVAATGDQALPRPEKLFEGDLYFLNVKPGMFGEFGKGAFRFLVYVDQVVNENAAVLRVDHGSRGVRFFAQKFKTAGLVDGLLLSERPDWPRTWLCVGTKMYGGETLFVVEPFEKK